MVRRSALVALTLVATPLALLPSRVAASDDPAVTARNHLRADGAGQVTLVPGPDGRLRFAGVRTRGVIDNPAVDGGDSVQAAARTHLARYGAALGAARGTTYVQRSTRRSVAGVDLVRFGQEVDGVPVLGGEVVLGMGRGHDLRSLAADVAPRVTVTDATVSPAAAGRTAVGLVRRDHPHADVTATDLGRWVLDPGVAGLDVPGGDRTVRRIEVGNGAGIRDLVLVDDHTGHVLFRTSLIEDADRVVCDDGGARSATTPCTSGFARTETSGPSIVPDVNHAFDNALEVSDFYGTVSAGQIDLTQMLGVSVSGVKKLAATVRFCTSTKSDGISYDDPCPYKNAFWDGTQMFYGAGFASADDVVGHEMTHGVVDQYSQLFYWGQSGAINESLADTMGEFVDQRNGTDDDSAWDLGEDLNLPSGPLRNMKDPTIDGQPDSMTSGLYTPDASYLDSGGVHTNSGVGNRTAYLISQGTGGVAVHGQVFNGIDAGDPSSPKSARLYLDVIQSLASGADYADLATQLDQSCADLVTAGASGFSAADCSAVHKATLATELTSPPANVPTPQPADTGCGDGYTKRVLFDSEAGDPPAAFTPDIGGPTGWRRGSGVFADDVWFVDDPATAGANSLVLTNPVAVPADQPSYLSFRGWWVLDFVPPGWSDSGYYDGGTVSLFVDGGPRQSPAAGWTNGPSQILSPNYGNPNAGWAAFGGDSRGWVRSRLDLGAFAGHSVQPLFTMRSDNSVALYGWALDDITIYTCDRNVPSTAQGLRAVGSLDGVTVGWTPPARFPEMVTGYGVRNSLYPGLSQVTASARTWKTGVARRFSSVTISIWTNWTPGVVPETPVGPVSIIVQRGYPTISAIRRGGYLRFRGHVRAGGSPLANVIVQIQQRGPTGWRTVGKVRTRSDGTYLTPSRRLTRGYYRALFPGAIGAIGTVSAFHRY